MLFLDCFSVKCKRGHLWRIAYCPQFDALNPQLTAREQLAFFCRIRAIPEERVNEVMRPIFLVLYIKDCGLILSLFSIIDHVLNFLMEIHTFPVKDIGFGYFR